MSEWSSWSVCRFCGKSKRKRTRKCNNPPPANRGKPCAGPLVQEMKCPRKHCKCKSRLPRPGLHIRYKNKFKRLDASLQFFFTRYRFYMEGKTGIILNDNLLTSCRWPLFQQRWDLVRGPHLVDAPIRVVAE